MNKPHHLNFTTPKTHSEASCTKNETSIKVVCRVRPLLPYEIQISAIPLVHLISDRIIGIGDGESLQTFTFDQVFDSDSGQNDVFEYVGKGMIEDIMQGYNGTILAYGQTGSGKTFTIMGDLGDEKSQGMVPRSIHEIFLQIEQDCQDTEFLIKCSMLEIYKDQLQDLLDQRSTGLKIKQCPRRGIYVQGLTSVCATNPKELLELVSMGEEFRTVASTKLNSCSSRSHLILVIEVIQNLMSGIEKRGVFNVVDLAGSEKVSKSGVTGIGLEEAKKINLSLSALGKVISSLVAGQDHIPYRDSKLTRLLQESLGGNFKTSLIVNCSPALSAREETLNSLSFAIRAKAIKNKAKVNIKESPESYLKTIEILKSELNSVRQELLVLKEKSFSNSVCSSCSLLSSSRKKKVVSSLIVPKRAETSKVSVESPITVTTGRHTPISQEVSVVDKKTFCFEPDSVNSSFQSPSKIHEESYHLKETLEDFGIDSKKKIEELEQSIRILKEENRNLEIKLKNSHEKALDSEKKSVEYYTLYHKTLNLINKDSEENQILIKKNEMLSKEVYQLTTALQEQEKRLASILDLCKSKDNTIIEFADSFSVYSRPIETEVDILLNTSSELEFSFKEVSIHPEQMTLSSPYGEMLKNALESNQVLNKDVIIFQLKSQLVQAGIYNSNLAFKLDSLNWKLSLLKKNLHISHFSNKQLKLQNQNFQKIIDFLYKYITKSFRPLEKSTETLSPTKKTKILRSFFAKSFKSNPDSDKSFYSVFISPSIDIDGDLITSKLKSLETKVNLLENYSIQLKSAYENCMIENKEGRDTMRINESNLMKMFHEEKKRWLAFYTESRKNCETELIRKQEEVRKLNELLAEWINNFMEVQEGVVTKEVHRKLQLMIINTVNFYSAVEKMNTIFSQCPIE